MSTPTRSVVDLATIVESNDATATVATGASR